MIPFEKLRSISKDIIEQLKNIPATDHGKTFAFQDYHGFSKTRLPNNMLEPLLQKHAEKKENLQIEIVGVHADLTDEVHIHRKSDAFVVILGRTTNFAEPFSAQGYMKNEWQFVDEGQEIEIPRETPHGFTVSANGGNLFFLSIQSPPIVGEDGTDDYTKVPR